MNAVSFTYALLEIRAIPIAHARQILVAVPNSKLVLGAAVLLVAVSFSPWPSGYRCLQLALPLARALDEVTDLLNLAFTGIGHCAQVRQIATAGSHCQ